ncbi:type II toxin-antitoxin system HicB family antitoxin [Trichormus sp. NMC-1]|uniref:type II toxin-antitoxin system HicB family antitoxin n=1 Tax=Trichormus sp. NMC-1 TaxID=1853259 RepID=UPI0008DC219E|nr:type II toxin-antitoxin system HicB family antitoxin [Trichormus sp. NMC-1]
MRTLIRLKIEKIIEDEQEYFVATSDDLQGLVAEGKTVQEALEIAEDVAKVLLELEKENNHNFYG